MWRKIALLVGVGAIGFVSWVGYVFHQATQLPEWYDPDAVVAEEGDAPPTGWVIVPDAERGEVRPSEGVAESARPRKRRELRGFHLRSTASNPAARAAVRASRASYEDGQLVAGVIIDVSKIPTEKLAPDDREFYRRALRSFPALRNREVYVGIEDTPLTDGPYLQLGPETRVRVGQLDYSLGRVARKLGISQKKVRKQINAELVRLKVTNPDAPSALDEALD